jgi:hypothetical protein
MDEVRVRLTWAEVLVAAQVGCMRNVQSLRGNWRPVGGCGLDDSWTANIEGACGEMVVAKHLGFYWTGALGDPTADDAGPYQVRTNASRRLDDMALRDRDKPKLDKVFISVLSFLPEFVICGWLYGHEGFREEWRRNGSPGRDPLYWVPRSALRPLATLPSPGEVLQSPPLSTLCTEDDERELAKGFG